MIIYNRKENKIENIKEELAGTLNFLYNTVLGRVILKYILARPYISKIRGRYLKMGITKRSIKPFIEKNKIDASEFDIDEFACFNDFFIRKRKNTEFQAEKNFLISPADSKLSVYKITDDLCFNVKRSSYTLSEILEDNELPEKYKGGYCLVFRLCVDDYHRYIYTDSGVLKRRYRIKGELHTVRPVSEKMKVFSRNTREISLLETENFGDVIQIEVGAMFVGAIKNHNIERFERGTEKGYFEFGGSTIVMLYDKNIKIDDDILEYSKKNIEVKVKAGEKIGIKI